jgi:hypothetical protein
MFKQCCNYNAILYYSVTVIEDVDCEFVEPKRVEKTMELKLSLEDYDGFNQSGNTGNRTDYFKANGRCVLPTVKPVLVKRSRQYNISFFDRDLLAMEGKCYVLPTVRSRLNIESFFGDEISLEIEIDRQ